MAAIIQGLDSYTPRQVGENASIELGWSNDIMEKIVQLHFQLIRSDKHHDLESQYRQILERFQGCENDFINEFCIAYKLAGFTRDIIKGKGEQQLSFMLIWCQWNYYPGLALHSAKTLCDLKDINNNEIHPYGSWKDVKYLCNYIRDRSKDENHPIIEFMIDLSIKQLNKDIQNFATNQQISLVSRWLPREKSKKFGWIFKKLARKLYPQYINTSTNRNRVAAIKKCKTNTRKLLSKLNKYIDTTQIKQCGNNWINIKFNNVTSCTMRKQKNAFMNVKKQGKVLVIRTDNEDRIACSSNFKQHIELAKNGSTEHKVHGKRCNVYELVKDAIEQKRISDETTIDTINQQWISNSENNNGLRNIIAMADTSGSMTSDNCIPLYNSIGLSIRVSEKCHEAFKDRVLIFDSTPVWCNLSGCRNFVEKVLKLERHNSGLNTNFYKALNMILDSIVQNNIPPSDVENLVLAVFSDMQIDCANRSDMNFNTLYENIEKMFHDAGMNSIYSTPYNPPHILFWNLRKTNGFPTLSSQKNVTMLSGYNATLLNVLCEKGVEELKKVTPFSMLENLLNDKRYDILESAVISMLEH